MFIDQRSFFRYHRLFCLVIFSVFICIGIYNYRYIARHQEYEYELIVEEKELFLPNITEKPTTESLYERFKARHELMKQKCKEHKLYGSNGVKRQPNAWEFLINDEYRLVWCNVFKAASTSWFYNFNLLAGYDKNFLDKTRETPVSLARKKYPRPSVKELNAALQSHLSFIIVRHPFERLVSAYRDKFGYPYNEYFRPLGNKIINAIRTEENCTKFEEYPPTFKEFVNYIICQWEYGAQINEHWNPVNSLCTPCQANFDLILKVETLKEDQDYLLNLAHLEDIIKPIWKNSARTGTTNYLRKKYFSQLDQEEFLKLSFMFKFDLELFGYSTEGYDFDSAESPDFFPTHTCKKKDYLNK